MCAFIVSECVVCVLCSKCVLFNVFIHIYNELFTHKYLLYEHHFDFVFISLHACDERMFLDDEIHQCLRKQFEWDRFNGKKMWFLTLHLA